MSTYTRPMPANVLHHVCNRKAAAITTPATDRQQKAVADLLVDAIHPPDGSTEVMAYSTLAERLTVVYRFLFGVDFVDQLTRGQASAMIAWLKAPEGWKLHEHAREEVAGVIEAAK